MIYDLTCFANHLTLMDWNVEPPPQRCVKSVSWKMSIQKLIWWRQACVLTTFKWYFACQQDHLQVFLVPYNIPCITITYRFIKFLIYDISNIDTEPKNYLKSYTQNAVNHYGRTLMSMIRKTTWHTINWFSKE